MNSELLMVYFNTYVGLVSMVGLVPTLVSPNILPGARSGSASHLKGPEQPVFSLLIIYRFQKPPLENIQISCIFMKKFKTFWKFSASTSGLKS